MSDKDNEDDKSASLGENPEMQSPQSAGNSPESSQARTSRLENHESPSDEKILSRESEEFVEIANGDERNVVANGRNDSDEKRGATVGTGSAVDEPKGSSEGQERKSAKEGKSSKPEVLQQSKSLEPLIEGKTSSNPVRIHRHCQRRFREMICKSESRKEELGKLEGNLRHRLDMLECSVPAVMVWNVWRMARSGIPIDDLRRAVERQIQLTSRRGCPDDVATDPSRHYDSRVRELEAERKSAQRRADEARTIWTQKQAALEAKRRKLEEAKKIQSEVKERIEQLDEQAKKLRSEAQKRHQENQECTAGECGDVKCRERWLQRISSTSSIGSTDLECLERLQELAEAELSLKKQIAELERREESYMRALQQADELWSRQEGESSRAVGELKGQLSAKSSANQVLADRVCRLEDELEKVRKKLTACRAELAKHTDVEWIDKEIGRDDDYAGVRESAALAKQRTQDQRAGREDGLAEILKSDKQVSAVAKTRDAQTARHRVHIADVGTGRELADTVDAGTSREEIHSTDAEVDRQTDLLDVEDKTTAVSPDELRDVERQIQMREAEVRKRELRRYLSMLGSLSELYKDDDYGVCESDFPCNDLVLNEAEGEARETRSEDTAIPVTSGRESSPRADKSIPLTPDESSPPARVPTVHADKSIQLAVEFEALARESQDALREDKPIDLVSEEPFTDDVSPDKSMPSVTERRSDRDKLMEGVSESWGITTAEAEIQTVPELADQMVGGEDDALDVAATLKHLPSEEHGRQVVRDVTAEAQHANELPELADRARTVESKEVAAGEDDAVIPLRELRMWLDDVVAVRAIISECPDCRVLKERTDKLAEKIAEYGTIDITEIPETAFEEEGKDSGVEEESGVLERWGPGIGMNDGEMLEKKTVTLDEMKPEELEHAEDSEGQAVEGQLISRDGHKEGIDAEERDVGERRGVEEQQVIKTEIPEKSEYEMADRDSQEMKVIKDIKVEKVSVESVDGWIKEEEEEWARSETIKEEEMTTKSEIKEEVEEKERFETFGEEEKGEEMTIKFEVKEEVEENQRSEVVGEEEEGEEMTIKFEVKEEVEEKQRSEAVEEEEEEEMTVKHEMKEEKDFEDDEASKDEEMKEEVVIGTIAPERPVPDKETPSSRKEIKTERAEEEQTPEIAEGPDAEIIRKREALARETESFKPEEKMPARKKEGIPTRKKVETPVKPKPPSEEEEELEGPPAQKEAEVKLLAIKKEEEDEEVEEEGVKEEEEEEGEEKLETMPEEETPLTKRETFEELPSAVDGARGKVSPSVERVISSIPGSRISSAGTTPSESIPTRPIDPRSVARPYLAVADIEERVAEAPGPSHPRVAPPMSKPMDRPMVTAPRRHRRITGLRAHPSAGDEEIESQRATTSQETQTDPLRIICRRHARARRKFETREAFDLEVVTTEVVKWRRRARDPLLTSVAEIQTDKPGKVRLGPTGRFLLIPEHRRKPFEVACQDERTCCSPGLETVSRSPGDLPLTKFDGDERTGWDPPAPLLLLREVVEQTTTRVERLAREGRVAREDVQVEDQLRKFVKDVPVDEEVPSGSAGPSDPTPLSPYVIRKRRVAEKRDMSCSVKVLRVKAGKSGSDASPMYPAKVTARKGRVQETTLDSSSSSDYHCSGQDETSTRRLSSRKTRDCS